MKVLIPLILLLAACSQPEPVAKIAQTPSGYPEAIFSGISAKDLSSKFAARCISKGFLLELQTEQKVVCEMPMSQDEIQWAKVFIGNQYSSDFHSYFQYSLVETSGKIRVQGREWVQLQMPYGQIRRREQNGPEYFNLLQQALYEMGGKPV